ncbi:Vesicular integral-membrane protein VIP36 [Halotydeus destructor]|nr:Vesicular integral-membrane protein VIP36 [Halotydeus destructor]
MSRVQAPVAINYLSSIVALLLICTSCIAQNQYLKREHSLGKPYQGSGMTIPNWDFLGSTFVTTSFIRLTPDEQSRTGSLWNKVPIYSPNWEAVVEFKVSGKGKDLFGDGMALWYVKTPLVPGPVFGNQELFDGLGIFLDTYANQNGVHNHGHPYISAMVNNGTVTYDHDRDGTHTELAGCEARFRGSEHETYLSIRYENEVLTVKTDIEGTGEWRECFSVKGISLPTGYHLGATAATGELSDAHDIISFKTYELEVPQSMQNQDRSHIVPSASIFAPPRDHVDDPPPSMSGLKLFMLIIVGIIGVGVLVVVGSMVFQNQQTNSKKRFY